MTVYMTSVWRIDALRHVLDVIFDGDFLSWSFLVTVANHITTVSIVDHE